MEFTSPYSRPRILRYLTLPSSANSIKRLCHLLNYSYPNKNSSIFCFSTQLPLRRPRRCQFHRPPHVAPPPVITRTPKQPGKTTATTSTSDILRLMDGLGLPIPIDVYISLMKECTDAKDADGAGELCAHISRSGLRPGLPFINRMLLMYVWCGLVNDARQLFDRMKIRDSNSWATMIAGYMDNANYEEAINMFVEMKYRNQQENDDLDRFPFSWIIFCILKACIETKKPQLGQQVHAFLIKFGYDEDSFIGISLMNFYGKFGCLEGVDSVFNQLAFHNNVVWTAKLVNMCREKRFDEALDVFKEMGREGVKKNGFTFSSVLRACSGMDDDGLCGQQVHANLIKLGLESNDYVQCGLVDMYAKCGTIKYAKRVFELIRDEKTAACWNAMLTGYTQHGYCIEAIKVLYAMKSVGIQPQESLIAGVRFTCGSKVPGDEIGLPRNELSGISSS